MNTPEPCGTCGFLYSDYTQENDTTYSAECLKNLLMGKADCPKYKYYKLVSMEEKWS